MPRITRYVRVAKFTPQGLLALAISALVVFGSPLAAWAHGYSTETLVFQLTGGKLTGKGTVPFSSLGFEDDNGDGLLEDSEFFRQLPAINADLLRTLQDNAGITGNGQSLPITSAGLTPPSSLTQSSEKGSPAVAVTMLFADITGNITSAEIRWAFASQGSPVIFQSEDAALVTYLNEEQIASFEFGFWASVNSFFQQGLGHIAFGADHLLFLVVLALGLFKVSVSKKAWLRAVKLIAAFTAGHALSFTLAYFHILAIPSGIVEPVIALSISLAAFAALTKLEWEKYWIIATAVGLVHGLGFASSLAQLGLATSQHAAAIISFNVGVDIAQVIVVSVVGTALVLARKILPRWSGWIAKGLLVAIGSLGVVWTVTRIADSVAAIVNFLN